MIHVALDIDDLLTSMAVSAIREQEVLDPVHYPDESFLSITFEYEDSQYTLDYVLVPGCIAFVQYLLGRPEVRLAFFSAGARARNVLLAERLVEVAIAAGGAAAWCERYDVFSREDCFDTDALPSGMRAVSDSPYQPPHYFGQLKKDLRVIHYGREVYHALFAQVGEGSDVLLPDAEKDKPLLQDVVLIEEDPSYLFPGQQRNMLLSPTYRHPYPWLVNYRGADMPAWNPASYSDSFKYTNTLFYAAGVMEHVLACCAGGEASLPDVLWEAQGRLWEDRKQSDDERFPLAFYETGRAALQRYSPGLNFGVAG